MPSDTEIEAELNVLAGPEDSEPRAGSRRTTADPSQPIIVFDNVSISFDGRSVLENVSFLVRRGETLCILGRSGVGKSVSLRMLMGFLKPDSGTIQVEGQEITNLR